MNTVMQVQPTLVTRQQAAQSMSLSERTVMAIPLDLLPVVRIGRAVRYRLADIEELAEKLARGEVTIGPVNG